MMNKESYDNLVTSLNQLDHNMRAQLSTMAKAHERIEKDLSESQMNPFTRKMIISLLDLIKASNTQLEWHATKLQGIIKATKE